MNDVAFFFPTRGIHVIKFLLVAIALAATLNGAIVLAI